MVGLIIAWNARSKITKDMTLLNCILVYKAYCQKCDFCLGYMCVSFYVIEWCLLSMMLDLGNSQEWTHQTLCLSCRLMVQRVTVQWVTPNFIPHTQSKSNGTKSSLSSLVSAFVIYPQMRVSSKPHFTSISAIPSSDGRQRDSFPTSFWYNS